MIITLHVTATDIVLQHDTSQREMKRITKEGVNLAV